MIPITSVEFDESDIESVVAVLRSGMIAQGPRVAEFEAAFAAMVGVKHAIAVNNGTTSLIASLSVLGLQPGDEVVTSPFTFVATLNAVLDAGATARFADISLDDFNVTASSLSDALTDRTRVIMPVHLYGQIAEMTSIAALAAQHDLAIVEDSAQAHGSSLDGRMAGSYGIGSFSLYATKNITTGEGGMITTDDDLIADKLRVLRNQGMRSRYQYEMAGNNYRMTDLQAALGLPQLGRYERVMATRKANAVRLTEALAGVAGLSTPVEMPGRRHVWHQYTVRVSEEAKVSRDELVERLHARGVGAGIYYPKAVFDYEPYKNHPRVLRGQFPNAEIAAGQVVSLPVHQNLSPGDIERISDAVRAELE